MLISDIMNKINEVLPLLNGQHDWDNIGVLVDTGSSSSRILLTIDITDSVIEECIRKDIKHIISYHPVIFSGIKKIKSTDLVSKLIKNGINVFSPHTSWDKEMNEYIYSLLEGQSPLQVLDTLKGIIGLNHVRIANMLSSYKKLIVGVGAAFRYHEYKDSLIVTGEMSHHCILHSVRNNNTVILLEHSNSERFTLPHMKKVLEGVLNECNLFISEEDKDPIEIL